MRSLANQLRALDTELRLLKRTGQIAHAQGCPLEPHAFAVELQNVWIPDGFTRAQALASPRNKCTCHLDARLKLLEYEVSDLFNTVGVERSIDA